MNRLLRDFLENLGYATVVLGLPLTFVVLGAYLASLFGFIAILPVGFGCIIAGVVLHTLLNPLR